MVVSGHPRLASCVLRRTKFALGAVHVPTEGRLERRVGVMIMMDVARRVSTEARKHGRTWRYGFGLKIQD